MELDRQERDGVPVIALRGRLDSAGSPQIQERLEDALPEHGSVVFDLREMSYLSSAGLRLLLLMHRRAERAGVRIALASVPSEVRAVMAATGFLSFFDVSDSVEAGLAAVHR